MIADGLVEADGKNTYFWDTTELLAGVYYVYGMIDDGNNVPTFDYSEGAVIVGDTGLAMTLEISAAAQGLRATPISYFF